MQCKPTLQSELRGEIHLGSVKDSYEPSLWFQKKAHSIDVIGFNSHKIYEDQRKNMKLWRNFPEMWCKMSDMPGLIIEVITAILEICQWSWERRKNISFSSFFFIFLCLTEWLKYNKTVLFIHKGLLDISAIYVYPVTPYFWSVIKNYVFWKKWGRGTKGYPFPTYMCEKCTNIYIISKYNRLYMNLFRIMNTKGINRCVVYICKQRR